MSLLKESQHLKIPLKEIEIATENFKLCIGKGGYGMVYKGELSVKGKVTTVAVKRLNEQFGQGLKEFLMEIQLLTGQKHPNLITLLGYCDEGKEKIIVYEYAEHGSLDQYLKRSSSVYSLTWLERLKICLDAARGLNHLHNHVGKHQTIIHRDIKSANILIDHNWVAKISDLGLSKLSLAGLNRSAVISHACGTRGYCEPEYFSSGIVKKESDVYSFGMVLFEVLCGRLCFITGDDGLLLSGPLAKDYYQKNKLDEIVDPWLRERMSLDLKNRFSKIAYECLLDDRQQRPPMERVVKELEEILKMQLSSSTLETSIKISGKPFSVSIGSSSMSVMGTQHISTELNSDKSLQARVNKVINTLDVGVDYKAMLFDLGNEETHKMNQDVVNVILESKKSIYNQKLFDLVDEYFDNTSQTLDFCMLLEKCLKRVHDTLPLIIVALKELNNEDIVEDNRPYEKTLESLKRLLEAVVDPFSEDFFNNFNSVYNRQIEFLEKNRRSKNEMHKKLGQWKMKLLTSLSKTFKNDIKGQRGVFDAMFGGCFITIKDLDDIRVLLENFHIKIESLTRNAQFAIKMDDALKFVMETIEGNIKSFSKDEEKLGILANNCIGTLKMLRSAVLRSIIRSPNAH